MNIRTIKSITCLALPLALLSACGETGEGSGEINEAANEHIELTSIEITGLNTPHLLQPIQVSVTADVSAAAYETNINVGLRSLDGSVGCVLGAMALDPEADAPTPDLEAGDLQPWSNEAEFIINGDCAPLASRDDLELFVGFDPWHELEGESFIGAIEQNPEFNLFTIVSASAVSVEGCASCESTYELQEPVGLDAQLLELNLASVVAVLPVAAEDGEEPIETTTHADFSLSMASRVTGLDKAQTLEDGLLHRTHRIRPLGSSDEGMPLVEREGSRSFEQGDVVVPGPSIVMSSAALHIEGATRDAIVDGVWSDLSEFELVTCLDSEFDQATFAGEDAPRDNDCGAIPVVLARETVGLDGLPIPTPAAGSATARSAEVYLDSWGANAGYGFGYSGLTFEAWLEANSSDSPTSTYGGISVYNAGSWYEAGIRADATVFDTDISLVDIYGTFIGYEFGGGGAAMGATILGYDFISPFEIQLADSVPLSLQDMFDAAGLDIDPTYTISYPIAGVSFDDGCDDVGASISVDTSIGIDTDETTVTASSTHQGVEIAGTFAPFFDVSVIASASTGDFLGISAGISATLTLLNITLPFTLAVEVIDYDPLDAMRLQFTETAGATFTTLSGSIDFVFKYKDFWGDTITHDHTIATWSGFSAYEEFFSLTQMINFGSDIGSSWCTSSSNPQEIHSGDFDGDGDEDLICHRLSDGKKWIDFGGSYGSTDWTNANHGGCLDDAALVVGDFDGDGRDDLFCREMSSTSRWIDYADANGEFYGLDWSENRSWCRNSNQVLRSADYNLDGRDDLMCYRPSDGYMWLAYADVNGEFGGTDWSGTDLPDILPSFISIGNVSVEENWVTVNLPQSFTNPVVIAGPPSFAGGDPAVVRIRNVGSTSFEIKVQEWNYLDDNHAVEEVAWMVIEAGVNVASDGTVWEAGTFTADGDLEVKTTQSFSNSFSSTPTLLASAQTYNGTAAIAVRVDSLGSSSFKVLLDEEEAQGNGHSDETIGYLALSAAPTETGSHSFFAGTASVAEDWTSVNGIELMMQEEISLDTELGHNNETVHVFGITPKFGGDALNFAQDVTYNGEDTASLRWR